ncbi:hypothetical protein V1512DRAFT_275290 [Lipomyces arxii]|uniref:uncharacterized protein n=1 Tax=Lipomyces arxii TaxID=56418 RepID=UPI0034CF018C
MASLFSNINPADADQSLLSLFDKTKEPVVKPKRAKFVRPVKEDEEQFSGAEEVLAMSDESVKEKKSKKRKKSQSVEKSGENGFAIEDDYLQKLLDQDVVPKKAKKAKKSAETEQSVNVKEDVKEDNKGDAKEDHEDNEDDGEEEGIATRIIHESLTKDEEEIVKAKRTVFVGNLPSSVISSKTDYIQLKKHFAAYGPIESIRFRSIAFSEMLPRKVAFIQQKLHDKRHTVNSYIVFESEDDARKSLKSNGEILFDHHLRVDSIAHPTKQDIKRSVFIGNLDFEAEEEVLWQHFSKIGQVEYVRIIRDSKTNVGKGFGYVQFKDSMYVSKALLENDKKVGTRKLRVTRARPIRKPAEESSRPIQKLDPDAKARIGRAKKLVGKAERAQLSDVVEGERAATGIPSLRPNGGKKNRTKPRIRARSTAFKKNNDAAKKGGAPTHKPAKGGK